MALNYKKQKNLVRSPSEYNRYYGDFRGVDFSSEETEVHEQRFAYAQNMYKDYRSSEGNVIETIPGFRKRSKRDGKINGLHYWKDKFGIENLIVHEGSKLGGLFGEKTSIGHTVNSSAQNNQDISIVISAPEAYLGVVDVFSIRGSDQSTKYSGFSFDAKTSTLTLHNRDGKWNYIIGTSISVLCMCYKYIELAAISDNPSSYFDFYDKLYVLDGSNIFICTRPSYSDDFPDVAGTPTATKISNSDNAYIPTTYKEIGMTAYSGTDISALEYEQENLLSDYYYHTYKGRTRGQAYPIFSADDIEAVIAVTPNGEEITMVKVEENAPAPETGEHRYTTKTYGNGAKYFIPEINVLSSTLPPINVGNTNIDSEGGSDSTDGVVDHTLYTFKIKYKKSGKDDDGNDISAVDKAKIDKCTIATVFDNRVFLSGNPKYPNTIWYCGYNNNVGYVEPTYFGELDYIQDGTDGAISCMMGVADTLAVLKSNATQSSSIYFHARHETGEPLIPVTYPSDGGIGGLGEIYACTNFRDDPIFVSELGVEAIGQLSVRLERAMEHRSSLIDAKLLNCDLSKAKLAEWEGYLVVLVPDGKIFLADSRQRYTHSSGVMQYEWYYLEGIGIYSDYQQEYYYASAKEESTPTTVMCDGVEYPLEFAKEIYNSESQRAENLMYSPVKPEDDETPDVRKETMSNGLEFYYILKDTWDGKSYQPHSTFPLTVKKAILCEDKGSKVGVGTFYPATSIYNIDRNLFFGTDNGTICSFNFDMREADGSLPRIAYNFNGVTINCGVATKLDNCGIPHLTKSTIKKSTVLKTKAMDHSAVKIKVRTNSKGYKSVARVNSSIFDMEDIDLSDLSFAIEEQPIFAIKEKEKHWVENQHWIYSDEFEKPFAIHYLAFRYKVSGRIK